MALALSQGKIFFPLREHSPMFAASMQPLLPEWTLFRWVFIFVVCTSFVRITIINKPTLIGILLAGLLLWWCGECDRPLSVSPPPTVNHAPETTAKHKNVKSKNGLLRTNNVNTDAGILLSYLKWLYSYCTFLCCSLDYIHSCCLNVYA